MLSPESVELLKELGKLNHGKALRELLTEHLNKMNDLTTCSSWEEAQGRKHAILVIKDIQAKLETKEKPLDKGGNQYA